jgi:rhodanese-related sulfurtransferase
VRSLEELGYEGVRVYAGGTREWEERGGRLVVGPDPG